MGIFTQLANAKKQPALTVTKTFDSPKAAIANARKLLAAGEISKSTFDKIISKLGKH